MATSAALTEEPALIAVGPDHAAACHRSAEITAGGTALFAPSWADTES